MLNCAHMGPCCVFAMTIILWSAIFSHGANFIKNNQPSRAFTPLETGWTDISLLSCLAGSVRSYRSCYSVQYKEDTGHCTPGSWMLQTSDPTGPTQSDIYTIDRYCDSNLKFFVNELDGFPFSACIVMSRKIETYREARDACRAMDAHLYTLKTKGELSWLAEQTKLLRESVWVGMDDITEDDTLRWVDDGEILTSELRTKLFKNGEPGVKRPGEDCVQFISDEHLLTRTGCDNHLRYFCTYNPVVELT